MKNTLLILLLIAALGCKSNYNKNSNDIFIFKLGDSGSMRQALSANDTIYLDRNYPYHELKEGDIIAYYDPDWNISHGLLHRVYRLSKNDPKEWIIKGDNNKHIDPTHLTEHNYNGKVIRVDFE
jgi:signal peptidase I